MECIFIFDAANRDMQRFVLYADQNRNLRVSLVLSSLSKKKYTRVVGKTQSNHFRLLQSKIFSSLEQPTAENSKIFCIITIGVALPPDDMRIIIFYIVAQYSAKPKISSRGLTQMQQIKKKVASEFLLELFPVFSSIAHLPLSKKGTS